MGLQFNETKCPICGRNFISPMENIYKLVINGKTVHFCRYNCFRTAQKREEEKKQKKKSGGTE